MMLTPQVQLSERVFTFLAALLLVLAGAGYWCTPQVERQIAPLVRAARPAAAQKQITPGRKHAPKKDKDRHKMAYPDVSYNIEGAGDPSYDLTFVYQGLDVNGNPFWSMGTGSAQRCLGYDPGPGNWNLNDADCSGTGTWGGSSPYADFATTPDAGTWEVGGDTPPAPSVSLTGTGSISGTVFLSTGGDLSGVAITVTGAATGSATSAEDGTWEIDGLVAGDYVIHWEKAHFVCVPQDVPVTLSED
jgi:hypothetical protein